MPAQVPVLNTPQVEAQPTAGDDYTQVSASPAAFGGTIGQAASGLGLSLQQQGKQLEGAAQFGDQIANETWATQGLTEASGRMADASSKFYSLHGQAAVDAYPEYIKQVQGIQSDVLGAMPSEAARAQAGQAMGYRMSMAFMGAGRFVAQQQLNWNMQATTAAADQSMTDAVNHRADPTASAAFVQGGAQNIGHVWALKGADPQTQQIMQQQYVGAATGRVVQSLLLDGRVGEAQARFDAMRGSMDAASQVRIGALLQPRVDAARAEQIVKGLAYTGPVRAPANVTPGEVGDVLTIIESGGRQFGPDGTPLTSPKGAVGAMQLTPGAVQDVAQATGVPYTFDDVRTNPTANKQVGSAYLGMQMQHFQDTTLAIAAYNAGPGAVDSAIKQFGDPRTGAISYQDFLGHLPAETQNYVHTAAAMLNLRAGIGTTDAPQNALFNPGAYMQKLTAAVVGESPDVQRRALAQGAQYVRQQAVMSEQSRATVRQSVQQTGNALWAGQDVPIPADQITAALPPAQAQVVLNTLHLAQAGGQVVKGMQWASPAEISDLEADLTGGSGSATALLRKAAGFVPGADGTLAPGDQAADFTLRQHVLALVGRQLQLRQRALHADPGGFVLGDPTVKADYAKAIASGNPADFGTYEITASATLAHLGVPAGQRWLLPAQDAQQIATSIQGADPAAAAAKLGALAKQFGPAWPRVFGQLVAQQHLPGDLGVIPALTMPGQAGTQADLIRAAQVMHEKGGMATWAKSALTPGAEGALGKALDQDQTLKQYHGSLFPGGAGASGGYPQVWESVFGAVNRLGLFYMGQGANAQAAAARAVRGIIGLKYGFVGGARVQAGTEAQAEQQINTMDAALTPKGLDPKHYTPAQAESLARATKTWVTNSGDNGLTMAYRDNSGILRHVWGANGAPIGFRFADLHNAVPPPAASDPVSAASYMAEGGG